MSLHVYLTISDFRDYLTISDFRDQSHTRIFIRKGGRTLEISWEEWNVKFPGWEPIISREYDRLVFTANITHNLGEMATAAQIYPYLWRPSEIDITKAYELEAPLQKAIARLEADPNLYKECNPPNGWGTYEDFLGFMEDYLAACKQHPQADITVSI